MISFEQAGFAYGRTAILNSITYELPTGSFHFLTGPSGAGKSTLLKLCYLALRPTSGQVKLFGHDVSKLSRDRVAEMRRRIGVVHQDCQFLDHQSVRANIELPMKVGGRNIGKNRANVDDLLSWVGLNKRADALPPELSGGERQRLAVARAVIMAPEVIIADEPTGNVDWEMGHRLLTLLVELNKMGKTIVIASHDLNLIRAAKPMVPTRVLRLVKGDLVAAGADL